MVYSLYKRQRILHYRIVKGFRPPTIVKLLREEGMTASERGIRKFIKTFMSTGRRFIAIVVTIFCLNVCSLVR